jgi:hypothetical protein
LTVSYQLFTDTAVRTIAINVNSFWPAASAWMNSNIQMIVFVYAFSWIFVLSSVLPSVILGKERSVLIQYGVCLVLTFLAFSIQGVIQIQQLFGEAIFLKNPIIAGIYLIVPYLIMVAIDVRSRSERRKREETEKQHLESIRLKEVLSES